MTYWLIFSIVHNVPLIIGVHNELRDYVEKLGITLVLVTS